MRTEGLTRFLAYVLGRRPDEFGLVPDGEGFVSLKELLQALHEEEAWRYVRRSHINEILLGDDRGLFGLAEERIRSTDPQWDPDRHHAVPSPPKVLFTPIRRRAHSAVMEKGLKGGGHHPLVLSIDKGMALRIGRRRDRDPVILEIMAGGAAEEGVRFHSFGDLFLTYGVPARFIAGPAAPKEMAEAVKEKDKTAHKPGPTGPSSPTPGTFVLDPSRDPDRYRKAKGKKPKGWKEAARRMRKQSKR